MDNSISKINTSENQDDEFVSIELKSSKSNITVSGFNDSKIDSLKGTLKEKRSVRQLFSVFALFRKRKDTHEKDKDETLRSSEKDKSSTLESTISPSAKESKNNSLKKGKIFENSLTKKETFNDLIEKGNTYFQQGDYQEAANLFTASFILDPKSEKNFHKKMSSIYAELAALDLGRQSCNNAQRKKVKQEIIEEKNKCQVNLSNEKLQTFLSKLSMQQIKLIAKDFSRYAYAIQKQFADYKKIKDLKKNYAYTVIRFERIQTAFGIVVTAHLIDKSSKYEVVILPNYFIQCLNRSLINDYNKCFSCKKLKIIYRGVDKFGEKLAFRV